MIDRMKESSDCIHMRLLEVRTVHWIQCKDQHHLPAYPTTSQLPRLPGYPGLPYSIPAITSNTWAIPEPSLVYTTTYKDTITSWIVLERKEERNPRSKVTNPLPSSHHTTFPLTTSPSNGQVDDISDTCGSFSETSPA